MAKSNEEYWRDRALELEEKWHTKSKETIERELAAYYRQSLQHIQRDIEALYGTFAKDNQLAMTDAKKILQGDEFRVWRMDIKEYLAQIDATGDPALLKELNTLAMRSRITRLDKLYSETLMELSKLAEKTGQSMDKFLTEAYKDGYYRNLFEIGKKAGLVSTPVKVDNKQAENVLRTPWSGKNYSERIWRNDARLADTIKETVTQGIHRGSSLQKLSKQVADKMNVGINDARRLVQTELNYVQNKSALDSIKEAGMGFYRVISTHDARTCQRCGDKDGEEIPVGDASPGDTLPPFHARCRCTIAASFGDGKAQKGRRIAKDKDGKNTHIPAAMNYKDWKAVCIDKTKTWTEWKKEVQEKENSGKINERPANEQDCLKDFKRYMLNSKTEAEKISQINPNFKTQEKQWTNNCQRCVVAHELVERGYDVIAKPWNKNDEIGSNGIKSWIMNAEEWWKDPDLKIVPSKAQFKNIVKDAFDDWGNGARAMVRIQWAKKYGGSGHFFSAKRVGDRIIYIDPQSGKVRNIDETLKKCTTAKCSLWFMRVDNRKLTDLVKEAVQNRE